MDARLRIGLTGLDGMGMHTINSVSYQNTGHGGPGLHIAQKGLSALSMTVDGYGDEELIIVRGGKSVAEGIIAEANAMIAGLARHDAANPGLLI
jgi:hypothetical protein